MIYVYKPFTEVMSQMELFTRLKLTHIMAFNQKEEFDVWVQLGNITLHLLGEDLRINVNYIIENLFTSQYRKNEGAFAKGLYHLGYPLPLICKLTGTSLANVKYYIYKCPVLDYDTWHDPNLDALDDYLRSEHMERGFRRKTCNTKIEPFFTYKT